MRLRTAILTMFLVVTVAFAGCAALYGVSGSEAKERALSAEAAYLSAQLENASCLETWGTTPTTASKDATIAGLTTEGVVVEVVHPYWYTTDSAEADLSSNAEYLVTETHTTRLSGDDVDPC